MISSLTCQYNRLSGRIVSRHDLQNSRLANEYGEHGLPHRQQYGISSHRCSLNNCRWKSTVGLPRFGNCCCASNSDVMIFFQIRQV